MTESKTKTKDQYTEGIGRRKEAVARIRITKAGKNVIAVNGRPAEDYFSTDDLLAIIRRPLQVAGSPVNYSVSAVIKGGGIHSQAEALALGLARALIINQPETKPAVKKAKLLSRDARVKERRKFGLKKARKAPQWSKR
ncbi:MAG: 30S ribosomal protein S9 [Candidatus Paceibacterota bacterium]